MNKFLTALFLVLGLSISGAVSAQDAANSDPATAEEIVPEGTNLDELLELVQQGRFAETQENRARENEFIQNRDRQQQMVNQAESDKAAEEQRSVRLERQFQDNERTLGELQATLQNRMATLGELFGVLQQVAGDTRGVLEGSLSSIHIEGRAEQLTDLINKSARGTNLPSIEEIEGLWGILLQEMVESQRVVRFTQEVWGVDGTPSTINLIRIGDFAVVGNGMYYNFDVNTKRVVELARQPEGRFLSTVSDLEETATSEFVPFGIDPTRGQLLIRLVGAPNLQERIAQGAEVGYIIIAMGIVGIIMVILQAARLLGITKKVRAQIKSGTPSDNNPLGRVLMVYEENKSVDVETLELKLDEAILKETPALERFLTLIKIISAVAPLFGLLGTVTGMIATFQAITLFGTGDPKLMAGGISQALVTTVLGLVVAIPTLLMHSFVAGMSKRVIHILEEQSAGIIAVHAEKEAR